MEESYMMTAQETADYLRVSIGKSYQIIRDLNQELKDAGYLTVAGKIPRAYLRTKLFTDGETSEDNKKK